MQVTLTKVCPAFGILDAMERQFHFDSFSFYFTILLILTIYLLYSHFKDHLKLPNFKSWYDSITSKLTKPNTLDSEIEMQEDSKPNPHSIFEDDTEVTLRPTAPLNDSSYGKL